MSERKTWVVVVREHMRRVLGHELMMADAGYVLVSKDNVIDDTWHPAIGFSRMASRLAPNVELGGACAAFWVDKQREQPTERPVEDIADIDIEPVNRSRYPDEEEQQALLRSLLDGVALPPGFRAVDGRTARFEFDAAEKQR